MTMPSDYFPNRVVSPYRIKAETAPKPSITRTNLAEQVRRINKAGEEQRIARENIARKKREEEENARIKADLEKKERDRIRAIEDAYRKKQAEKQRQYEEQKRQNAIQAAEDKKKSDKLYEPEYQAWKDDVMKNKDNYSLSTRAAVIASEQGPVYDAFARALFNIKNYFGNLAINSIDTNGNRIAGEIGLMQHKLDALPYHQKAIELDQTIMDLEEERDSLLAGRAEDGNYVDNGRYEELTSAINNLLAQRSDPILKKFDEDYKQLYTIDKSGFWDTVKRGYQAAVSGLTYDQYKDEIAARDRLRDVENYYKTLTEEEYRQNRGYKGADFMYSKVPTGAGYRAPEVRRRDLYTYTPKEILALDAQKTAQRAEEFKNELAAKQQELIESRNHLKDSQDYWNVSEYFKHGVRAHQNDKLNSLGYWGYTTSELMGSTFSSPKQALSTGLQGLSMAAYASSPYTGGAGALVGIGSGVAAGVAGIYSGYDENSTEAGDKRVDNFRGLLSRPEVNKYDGVLKEMKDRSRTYWRLQGWTEKQINEYLDGEKGDTRAINDYFSHLTDRMPLSEVYKNPITDPDVEDALQYSTMGLNALYDADNMRTVMSNVAEVAFTVTPTKWAVNAAKARLSKIGQNIASREAGGQVTTNAAGKVVMEPAEKTAARQTAKNTASGTYANGFRRKSFEEAVKSSFIRGAAIGEATGLGFAGAGIVGTTAAVARGLSRAGISMLSPKARSVYRALEEAAIHKYQGVYDKLLPNSKFGKAVVIYGARTARNTIASGLTEGAEEAVQYLNSHEDYASKYGWNGMSLSDMVVNDLYQGNRVFNTYMAMFGLSNSELMNDPEYWSNYRGGFALSMLHTGTIRLGIEGFNAYKEIPTHSAIITSNIMQREMEAHDRAANVEFARQAMRNRSDETLSVLDWMERNDSRREDPFYTQEDYDEKRKAARRIQAMVNDKDIREKLQAKGIVYGTEEFANAIADLYSIEDQRQQNATESKEQEADLHKFYNSPEYQKEATDIAEELMQQSFESVIGIQTAVTRAGNEAVSTEIANKNKEIADKRAAIEVEIQRKIQSDTQNGIDTTTKAYNKSIEDLRKSRFAELESVESPDFQKHLEEVRSEAQETARKNISVDGRNKIINLSHAAHKLKALITLRAQQNTTEDFFKFLSSKFNLKVKRPDAKLIEQSVDKQIAEVKKQLAEIDENFNENLSDKAILDYIENLPIIRSNEEEIDHKEIAAAMLQADREIIDRHLQAVEYGLVKNKDGKWEYNPAAYKVKQEKAKRLGKQLGKGEINFEEYMRQLSQEDEMPAANPEDVKDNLYKKRIQAIMETRKENKALNWMINDIEKGDGVTRILEQIAKDEEKASNSEEVKQQAKEESETLAFERGSSEPVQSQPTVQSTQATPKEKYQKRASRSKQKYQQRKKSLRELRKNLRNRANGMIIPIPTPLLDFANYLIHKVQLGTYKIAQFAEELKNFAEKKGIDANEFLSGIKEYYINNTLEMMIEDPTVAENISPIEEIMSFNFGTDLGFTQPIVFGTAQEIQDQINADTAKINTTLSSHYDTIVNEGDTVVVYPNREAIINARFGEQHYEWKRTVEILNAANTSDDDFRSALQEIFKNYQNVPIDEYVKYRNVEGIIEAIANVRSSTENEESIQNGKHIRNAIVSILLDREDQIDRSYFLGDYEGFRNQVLQFKEKLTSKTNGLGLSIIDTFSLIYGLDKNGQRVSSEADIIATNGDKLYVIDVRYSFQSIYDHWNYKYPRATFTINEHVTRRVKQIEQIINSKFNKGVNGLYCLPVIYDPRGKTEMPDGTTIKGYLSVEIRNNSFVIEVKPDSQDEHYQSLEDYESGAEALVDEINRNITEYNTLVEEARRYSDLYEYIDPIELQQYDSIQEYVDYVNTLHARYDNLIDRINEMKQVINRGDNLYEEVWNTGQFVPSETISIDNKALLDRLHTVCQELDSMIDQIPDLKVTTQEEKNNIEQLIDLIFEAQRCLDDVLQNTDIQNIDVYPEQELIATALEKMAQNKEAFGSSSVFVRNWWATNFVVGPRQNRSVSVESVWDQYRGYINKIDSWVSTLRNHVLSELDSNFALQEWYSAILNNYLSELISNAEQFANSNITDAAQLQRIQNSIKEGRDLIEDFNNIWDTRPEEGFNGPVSSPADLINRMPTKWKDLYGTTTSVMPAFDQMSNRDGKHSHYYWLSLSPTFLDSKFILSLDRNGKLQLYIEGKSLDGTTRNTTLTFENDLSKARPEDAERWQYVNNAKQRFIRKAIAAIKFVQEHPDYEIRFDKYTNKGQVDYNQDGKLMHVTNWVFKNSSNQHNLYTIKLSKDNRMGILVRIKSNETGVETYNVKGGDNMLDDIGGFDRDFLKQKLHIQSGSLVYYYDTGNGQYIGIPIESFPIGEDDAAKLVYLMERYIRGDRVDQYGYNIYDLLSMRLYMASPDVQLSRYKNVTNLIRFEGTNVIVGNQSYDIVSQKAALIARISQMSNVTRGLMMNQNLRTMDNSVISKVRTLLGAGGYQSVQLTNGLVFNIDDFTHHNEEPGSQDGSTWLGYMLRNGLLGSSAFRLGYKELRIDNLRVVKKGTQEQPSVSEQIRQANQQKPKIVIKRTEDIFANLAKLKMTVNESEIDQNRGSEEQESFVNAVTDYFNKVLGTTAGKLTFSDEKFLMAVSKNERVIGICTAEGIKLSKYAPLSVAWHEAFHKIFELAIPAEDRDALYNAYKNRWWRRLITKPNDRDVAEAFADMFVTYMTNKEALNKADSFVKKIMPWVKTFAFNIGMQFSIGKQNAEKVYQMYADINAGKYKNREITKEQNERFKRLFKDGLFYTVTNSDTKTTAEFSHLANIGDRDKLVRGLAYWILTSYGMNEIHPNVAKVRITGGRRDMIATPDKLNPELIKHLKESHPVFEEVFESVEEEFEGKDGKVIKRTYYPKFEALSRHIADYISTIFDTMRKPKIEEDDTDNTSDKQVDTGENEDFMSNDTDHWDKAAYEFSKLSGLLDEVKLFFGTIPYAKYQDEVQPDGSVERSVVIDFGRNKFGCPEFMPIEDTWNVIVNECSTAKDIQELDKMLENLAGRKEVYYQIYVKYHELISDIYKYNEDGKVIVAQTNFDKESFAIQILSAIQSQKINYLVGLSSKQKDQENGGKEVRIVESSMDRDSKSYADQWTQYLVSGQIGVFERERAEGLQLDSEGRRKRTVLIFKEGMGGKNNTDIFSRTANFFETLRNALLSNADEIEIEGRKYNKLVYDDANLIKDQIISKLNNIGIMFEKDALDHMLAELYGGVDIEGITRFLNDSPVSSDPQIVADARLSTLTSFINKLNGYVSANGVLNQRELEEKGYGDIGFVNKLATWEGKYRRVHSQNMALALNGKKLYSISQNNTISHIIKALNTSDLDNETINVLSRFEYNIHKNDMGLPIGSIIMKAIQNRKALNIKGYTYIGFKTDNKGDQGSEYTEESTAEDYIAKLTMLQQGYLIFPTLSDKSTWMILDGVDIPGMRFVNTKTTNGDEVTLVDNAPSVKIFGGKAYLVPNDAVLDQMIEYAKCELLGIQECMNDLGTEAYPEIPGYTGERRTTPLSESQKIDNYHRNNSYKDSKGETHTVEPNGTRFLSLTKLVVNEYDSETKKYKLNTYNLNDPRESSVNLLKLANEKFFARREGETNEQMIERQRETMALTLAIQTDNGIIAAENLGIIQRTGYQTKVGDRTLTISANEHSLLNLDSKDLNAKQIDALTRHIMSTTSYRRSELKWKDIKDVNERAHYAKMARSLAIAAIIQDATNRHIICSQEVQRCFSGHPALFKVKYSSTGIKDSAYDIQKRIGGLVSTGEDNVMGLPGIQGEYTCAECKDYEVSSRSNIAGRLEEMFSTSHAKFIVSQKLKGRVKSSEIYKKTIDELKQDYPHLEHTIDKALEEGKKYAKSFQKGDINVADGAAYITADMCRDMLRMRGAYNNKTRKAFKILMSSSKYDWVKSAEAYKTVYEALNIVPTKYTAYGFRSHSENGSNVSNVAVAYYNKFALFPIFPGMATGKMSGVYQKMLDEGVDMLLMTSAVKVGSQGAVEFDGETISAPFNKYKQSYAYLRRQLNTDPKEKDTNPIGTQMMKIGLANLDAEREYVDNDGNVVSGQKLLDDLMGSINALAKIGAQELEDMFTDTEEVRDNDGNLIGVNRNINYEKVSNYLKEELTQRNANKTLIQAIQYDPKTKKLSCPLAATTDAQWIESIFISTMNKKIVDITTPGKSFIQRSVFAMEGKAQEGEGLIQSDKDMSPTLNGGNRLQMINEDHSMDCVVSIDYFRDILPKDLSFEQAKQWLIDQGIISGVRTGEIEWSNAEATIIGYRIPTQAQSSIHALRVVDVLQAAKDTIILPEEFTKVTGADFDIDHLYLASFNFRMDDTGHLTRHFDIDTKEYHQNRILESLMTLLKDTENSLNSLFKPIDNDTELVTDVSDYIPESGSTKDDPYNFGTLHEQVIRKNDYITGKKGIAPFALNSTSHMLGKVYGIKFKNTKLVEGTRLKDLDTSLDKDDNVVASWLSGFINAHVDIVKDPYISRLNVNQFTYNMLNLMCRCGWGDAALWFLANPVIRSMSAANDLADSQYMRRPSDQKSGKTYREELILNSLKDYLSEDEISDETLTDLLNNKNRSNERASIINWLEANEDKLRDAAINGKVDHDTALNVFYAWKILEKYANALSGLVQHTKVDTRKYGKNFIAVRKYAQECNDIFYPEDPETSVWDLPSLRRMYEHSWLKTKTELVAQFPAKIFGGLTFNANDRFVDGVLKFAKELEYDGRVLYQDDVVELAKHLQTAIKSKYFTRYAREVLKLKDSDIAGLFTGYTSMNRQLVSLKHLIANDPNYARLADNPFLNQIYSMLEDKPVFANGREMADRPGFVTVLDNVDDSKVNSDLLSEGWLDLMNDENPRVRKLAKKFVVYAFFSSGEFKGWNKMLKYVPYEWISGEVDPGFESYSEYIDKQLNTVSDDYSDLYDDIVANNFMDYRFAKQMELVNPDNTKNFLNDDRGVKIGKGVSADQVGDLAEYVSIKKPGMYSGHQSSYDLYKKIAEVGVGKHVYPVYAKIKKRGYHTRGNDIYEYDWDFNYAENEAKGSDTFDYEAALERVKEFIQTGALDGFTDANIRAINKVFKSTEPLPVDTRTAPQKKVVEPGAHIATRGYKKGDPQKHPEFNYVFTENAQAYIATADAMKDSNTRMNMISAEHPENIGVPVDPEHVKLNVSDVNGTNQAGIRTDEHGRITQNAYGIVVKKFQQTADGRFVAQEGTFKDTDEDFKMFRDLNEDVFYNLEHSQNKVIVFPQQMALGKAALPKRFAEWLQVQLLDRFGVVSEVVKNERGDYEGYGLKIERVEPKESNLLQDREYDWKYEEDSGYSGVLESLPPKVRMNGKMVYRPQYDFGRVYLTDNEKQFVEEYVNIVDENGNVQSINTDKIGYVIESISNSYDHLINKSGFKFISISYKDWKMLLQSSDSFEEFVTHRITNEMEEINGFNYTDLIGEYNKSTKTIQIEEDFYNMVKLMSDNIDAVDDLINLVDNKWVAADMLIRYENIYDAFEDLVNGEYEESVYQHNNISLQYSYSDKRQQELFSDEDFELTEEEKKEAKRYRNMCEGGI